MQFGLWFPVSWGAMSNSENPAVWPDQIPTPGEEAPSGAPPLVYQNGYLQEGGAPARLCIAFEPYFTMFQRAILHHTHVNGLKLYKLDGINSQTPPQSVWLSEWGASKAVAQVVLSSR